MVTSQGDGPKVSCDLPSPLAETFDLEIALQTSLQTVAGDMVERVGFADIRAGPMIAAISHSQSSLVEPRGFSTASWGAQRGVGLDEEDQLSRDRRARFLGMVRIVQADRDEFRNAGDWGAEALLAVDGGEF